MQMQKLVKKKQKTKNWSSIEDIKPFMRKVFKVAMQERITKPLQRNGYYATPSRPEGPRRCPDRGNTGVH